MVHFSGHGQGTAGVHGPASAPSRDFESELDHNNAATRAALPTGLFFQGSDGSAQLISTRAIEQTFGAASASVRLVVLNACCTDAQAEALLAHVECVVGMAGSIRDDAAKSFAVGFYGGIGEREPIAAAFRQGRATPMQWSRARQPPTGTA